MQIPSARFPLQPSEGGTKEHKTDGLEVRVKGSSQADSAVLDKGLGGPSVRAPANQALTSTGIGALTPAAGSQGAAGTGKAHGPPPPPG